MAISIYMYIKEQGFLSRYWIWKIYQLSSHFMDHFILFPFASNDHVFQMVGKESGAWFFTWESKTIQEGSTTKEQTFYTQSDCFQESLDDGKVKFMKLIRLFNNQSIRCQETRTHWFANANLMRQVLNWSNIWYCLLIWRCLHMLGAFGCCNFLCFTLDSFVDWDPLALDL